MLIFIKKPKQLIAVIIITLIFTSFSKSLTSRLSRTFQVKQIFVNQKTGQVIVPQRISTQEVPAGTLYVNLGKTNLSSSQVLPLNQRLTNEKIREDIRKSAAKEGKKLTQEEEDRLFASISATLKPISTILPDISFATRLQVEWPRAIHAFFKNPILGSGVSSITEATDNDYLRWLGETGILGTALFLTILFSIAKLIFISIKKFKEDKKILYLGFLFGLVGLMINASYIDVFEASKVAYTFWLLAGIFVGSLLIL